MTDDWPSAGTLLATRYRLVALLETGGMAQIWHATDELLARPVAIKLPTGPQVVWREARMAAKLSHPGIAAVHDYREAVRADGTVAPFVVMELLSGETVAAHLVRENFTWQEAARVGAAVATALAAAHTSGVVHRDIKPGNVMLTPTGVKILDFGISATAGEPDDDDTGATFGTPAYVAPERLDGMPAEPATDVYGLGVLLFEMVTGQPPYPVETWEELDEARLEGPGTLPGSLPAGFRAVVEGCLAELPADRPPADEIRFTLTALWLADQPDKPAGSPARAAGAPTLRDAEGSAAAQPEGAAFAAGSPTAYSKPPAFSEPALSKPALSKPALSKPALSESALSKPALSKPALSKPALSESALSESALSESAAFSEVAPSSPAATAARRPADPPVAGFYHPANPRTGARRPEGRAEGRLEGRAEGRLEGRAEGRLEGRTEGRLEGRTEGRLEGRTEGRLEGRTEGRPADGRPRTRPRVAEVWPSHPHGGGHNPHSAPGFAPGRASAATLPMTAPPPKRRLALVLALLALLAAAGGIYTVVNRGREKPAAPTAAPSYPATLFYSLEPATPIPPTRPTTAPTTTTSPSPSPAPSLSPSPKLSFDDALSRLRTAVENGASSGDIRDDVATDLLNLIRNLQRADVKDVDAQVAQLRRKVDERADEGSLPPAQAAALRARLSDLDRAAGM